MVVVAGVEGFLHLAVVVVVIVVAVFSLEQRNKHSLTRRSDRRPSSACRVESSESHRVASLISLCPPLHP